MILGIDPGYERVGFAIIEKEGKEKVISMGRIRTSSDLPFAKRLCIIHRDLQEILISYPIKQCAIESIFFTTNKKTAIAVAHARGVLLQAVAEREIAIFEYTPTQIKKSVTSSAKADKNSMITMLTYLYGISASKDLDDACDALGTAFTHKHSVSRLLHV